MSGHTSEPQFSGHDLAFQPPARASPLWTSGSFTSAAASTASRLPATPRAQGLCPRGSIPCPHICRWPREMSGVVPACLARRGVLLR